MLQAARPAGSPRSHAARGAAGADRRTLERAADLLERLASNSRRQSAATMRRMEHRVRVQQSGPRGAPAEDVKRAESALDELLATTCFG